MPKSQDDAIHAVTSARSHDAQPQKLHEEITPFKDDWGLDAEGERETGVKYSGREEKPVPNSPDPKLDDLAEERKKAGKGPEAVKKAVEEQEKNGSKL